MAVDVPIASQDPAHYAGAWPAMPMYVPRARRAVGAFLTEGGVGTPLVGDVALAVSESITNVVYHAYVGEHVGEFRVFVRLTRDLVEVTVEDDGAGMRPRPDTPGLGLGLPVIATLATTVETTTTAGQGTRVRMRFTRPSTA